MSKVLRNIGLLTAGIFLLTGVSAEASVQDGDISYATGTVESFDADSNIVTVEVLASDSLEQGSQLQLDFVDPTRHHLIVRRVAPKAFQVFWRSALKQCGELVRIILAQRTQQNTQAVRQYLDLSIARQL